MDGKEMLDRIIRGWKWNNEVDIHDHCSVEENGRQDMNGKWV